MGAARQAVKCPTRVHEALSGKPVLFPAGAAQKRINYFPDSCWIGNIVVNGKNRRNALAVVGTYQLDGKNEQVWMEVVESKDGDFRPVKRPLAELEAGLCLSMSAQLGRYASEGAPGKGPEEPHWMSAAEKEFYYQDGNEICLKLKMSPPFSGELKTCESSEAVHGRLKLAAEYGKFADAYQKIRTDVAVRWPGAKALYAHYDFVPSEDEKNFYYLVLAKVLNGGEKFDALYRLNKNLDLTLVSTTVQAEAGLWPKLHIVKVDPSAGKKTVHGNWGLAKAVKEGYLRPATRADFDQASQYLLKQARRLNPQDNIKLPEMEDWQKTEALKNLYVVVREMHELPALFGLDAKIFMVPRGTARPAKNVGHSAIVDLNDEDCKGCNQAAGELVGDSLGFPDDRAPAEAEAAPTAEE